MPPKDDFGKKMVAMVLSARGMRKVKVMTDENPINETYTLTIIRNGTEFEVKDFMPPKDDFGKKMVAMVLYRIGEHLDPAFAEQVNPQGGA